MQKINVSLSNDGRTAYLRLPGHALVPGIVRQTICLADLIQDYKGPMINIDFDESGRAIAVEVLVLGQDP